MEADRQPLEVVVDPLPQVAAARPGRSGRTGAGSRACRRTRPPRPPRTPGRPRSGRSASPSRSGGMPWSMPSMTRYGPAIPAAFCTSSSATATASSAPVRAEQRAEQRPAADPQPRRPPPASACPRRRCRLGVDSPVGAGRARRAPSMPASARSAAAARRAPPGTPARSPAARSGCRSRRSRRPGAARPGRRARPSTGGARRAARWCRRARRPAPPRPAPRCARRAPTAGRRAPAPAGRPRTARASASRCRWPPESDRPCSPTRVSRPHGRSYDEVGLGDASASSISSSVGVGAAEREVLPHRHGEQRRLLERDADHARAASRAAGRGCRGRRG